MELDGEGLNFNEILGRPLKTPRISVDDVSESRFLPIFQPEQWRNGPPPLVESDDALQDDEVTVFQSLIGMMQNVHSNCPVVNLCLVWDCLVSCLLTSSV